MNIAIVCGARPNLMKVAPIIRAIRNNKHFGGVNYQLTLHLSHLSSMI